MRIVLVVVASILVAGYVEASLDAQQYGAGGGAYGRESPAQRLKAGLFNDDNSGSKDGGDYQKNDNKNDYNKDYNKPKTVTKTVTEREPGQVVEKTVTVTETVHDRKTVTVRGDTETVTETVTKTKRGHVETVTETVHDVDTVTKTKTKWRTHEVTKTTNGGGKKTTTITDTITKFKKTLTTTVFQGTLGTLTTTHVSFSTLTTTSTSHVNGGTTTETVTTSNGSVPPVTTTITSSVSTSSVAPETSCDPFTEKKSKKLDNERGNNMKLRRVDTRALCEEKCCDAETCQFYRYESRNKECTLYNYSVTFVAGGSGREETYYVKPADP